MRTRTRELPDAGSIAPAVPVLAMVLLLLAGLVLDASRQLAARARAVAYAEEAARAGAAAVDVDAQELVLLPDTLVRERVESYCRSAAAAGAPIAPGSCFVGVGEQGDPYGRRVVVTTHVEIVLPASLLGVVGVRELRAAGDARARPFEGTATEDAT